MINRKDETDRLHADDGARAGRGPAAAGGRPCRCYRPLSSRGTWTRTSPPVPVPYATVAVP
jgi:hypothetical protein